MVAATLRPETMYGQTNCFALPTVRARALRVSGGTLMWARQGEYGAFRVSAGEIFICTDRSALNISYQVRSDMFTSVRRCVTAECRASRAIQTGVARWTRWMGVRTMAALLLC